MFPFNLNVACQKLCEQENKKHFQVSIFLFRPWQRKVQRTTVSNITVVVNLRSADPLTVNVKVKPLDLFRFQKRIMLKPSSPKAVPCLSVLLDLNRTSLLVQVFWNPLYGRWSFCLFLCSFYTCVRHIYSQFFPLFIPSHVTRKAFHMLLQPHIFPVF